MVDFYHKYKQGKKLGEGAFGAVHICYLISDKNRTEYALKILSKSKLLGQKVMENLLANELNILMHTNHPNIVRVFDVT